MSKRQFTETTRLTTAHVPFAVMDEQRIDFLASLDAFSGLDPDFRDSKFFRNILSTHTRLTWYKDGDVIIREGEWGNSAFIVVHGSVRVALESLDAISEGNAPTSNASKSKKKSLASVFTSWLSRRQSSEFRDVTTYGIDTSPRVDMLSDSRVFVQDVPAILENYRTVELSAGAHFGELAALGRTARTSTVFASGDVELLEIRWQGLRDLIRRDQGFRKQIDESFRRNALQSFLVSSPLFSHLEKDPIALVEVIQEAEFHTYGEYDRVGTYRELAEEGARTNLVNEPVIAAEGNYPNGITIVRSGIARVTRKHHHGHLTVNYLCPGQVFGYDEIKTNFLNEGDPTPLQNTLRAIGFISVIHLPTVMVEKHLLEGRVGPRPQGMASHFKRRAEPDSPTTVQSGQVPSDLIEFVVQERFINGAQTMLIDMDRCTRCDDCVKACASAHDNNPRFVRQGPIHRQVMVANACMHCQDPLCLIECPTGAISRHTEEGVVTINDTTCIGCSTCANNCPYSAIRMVEIRDENGSFIRDISTRQPIAKATKCDLCVDQRTGPACQNACPHDALVRMDMRSLQRIADWRNR